MATRLYLVPAVGSGADGDPRLPAYFSDGTVTALGDLDVMDYGFEPWMLVAADLTPADHTTLADAPNTSVLPADLTPLLTGAQVTATKAQLEAMNIPAGWVNTSTTWIELVRIVRGMIMYVQRFTALHGGPIFLGNVNLNSTVGSLPVKVRGDLTTAAADLRLDTTGIVGTTTLRTAWKLLADQLVTRPVFLGPLAI